MELTRSQSSSQSGLYLHIPFCARICPYCDFAVTTGSRARRTAFVESLVAEIDLWKASPEPASHDFQRFDTLYLGGGTPSALLPEDLGQILTAVRGSFEVPTDARLFLEANPEDVTPTVAAAWRSLGFATLSLGIQSLDASRLAFLGRAHDPESARRSVEIARQSGFETVSVDLIYGLPNQSTDDWRREIESAVALAPDHLSCYQLTFHEGTPFGRRLARGALTELPEPAQADLFTLTHTLLADAGYEGYEVSNFARAPEHRSRHNQKYWDHTPYLGLGPSAHSFAGTRRWWNERHLAGWQACVERGERPIAGSEELTPPQLALEAVMLGLRTREGIDLLRFHERYGVDLAAANQSLIGRLEAEGYLDSAALPNRAAPTLRGLAVADSLARSFDLGEGPERRGTTVRGV